MKTLQIDSTKEKEVINITQDIQDLIENHTGLVNLFLKNTGAALTVTEFDPETENNYINSYKLLNLLFKYQQTYNNPNFPDHFLSSTIGANISIPVKNGALQLDTNQKIALMEFSGPLKREIILTFIKE